MTETAVSAPTVVVARAPGDQPMPLDAAALHLYRRLQQSGAMSGAGTRRVLLELGEEPLRQLVELGLVRQQGRGIAAVPHAELVDRLLTEQTVLLRTALGEVQRRQRVLRTILEAGPELDGDGSERVQSVSLRDRDPMSAVPAAARHELMAIQPGGRFPCEVLEQSLQHARRSAEAGVRLRVVHQTGALAHREVVAYLEALERLGAHIRVRDNVPFRLLMVDREAALCEMPSASPGDEALLIRGARVLSLIERVFESAWVDSEPFRTALASRRRRPAPAADGVGGCLTPQSSGAPQSSDAPQLSGAPQSSDAPQSSGAPQSQADDEALARRYARLTAQQQLILRYLAEGQTDGMIARRVGVTPRTVTRRIAEIYRELEVESRFQAGVVAHRLGLV
jgi:DNA-binding CsgD family transcriptional regulator